MNPSDNPKRSRQTGEATQRRLERFVRRIHVIPIGDVELHAAQEICWCHPIETEPKIWVHNAKDCREARERATGEKSSEGWINIAEYVPPNDGAMQ